MIYQETSDDFWCRYKYDEKGHVVYCENSDGDVFEPEVTYSGNNVHIKTSDEYWEKYEYDDNGNLLYKESSDGSYTKYIVVVR